MPRAALCFLLLTAFTAAAQTPAFRTDGGDEKLPWYQIKPGEFPPEGSAHRLSGELIQLDHINRTGQLRPDRSNDQRTDDYDRPLPFTMLPFGTIRYHGAPAELRDVPIGTHLHGQLYFDPKAGKDNKGAFTKAFLLEDDFSFQEREQKTWRLDVIDKGTITVTGQNVSDNTTDPKPTIFHINPSTRIWKGTGFGALSDLTIGQSLVINLTVCTLKGPGRCTDIWIDEESRRLATAHQLEVHRAFQKTHGLPGWIDSVDNEKSQMSVTMFAGFDPGFKDDWKINSRVAALVSEDSLRSYDQINDRMYAQVLEVRTLPALPGSSGVQLLIKPESLLEGFRPGRFVRLLSEKYPLDDLPYEERLYK